MKITILLLLHFVVFISVTQSQPGRSDALNCLRQIRRRVSRIQQSLAEVITLEKQLLEGEPTPENLRKKTNTKHKLRKSDKHLPFHKWAGRWSKNDLKTAMWYFTQNKEKTWCLDGCLPALLDHFLLGLLILLILFGLVLLCPAGVDTVWHLLTQQQGL